MNDTIAAIATAYGVASIAIVRISGADARRIAARLTHDRPLKPRYAHLASLYDASDEVIDQALVIYFQAPHSFTGEDIVEFQCHGGIAVAQTVLETLLAYGARLAEPGEFTKRAFLNGKIDLSEAEAIAKTIEAKSTEAVKVLARHMQGEIKRFVDETQRAMVRILAHTEVTIDYAEEDLPEDIKATVFDQLRSLRQTMDTLVDSSLRRQGMIEGFRVTIVGKPNVGKSSLLNALLSKDRAIVSDIAGTTRDTIEEEVRIGTHVIRLIDTAGIRQAGDTIERIGIERSLHSIEEADVIIALFDASRPFDEQDAHIVEVLDRYRKEGKTVIAALNKSDLPQVIDTDRIADFDPIEVSAKRHFTRLTVRLQEVLDTMSAGDEPMLVSMRQIEAVKQTMQSIDDAFAPLEAGELEFFAYHIQEALKAIGSISKPYDNEAVLDAMFSEFCLGK